MSWLTFLVRLNRPFIAIGVKVCGVFSGSSLFAFKIIHFHFLPGRRTSHFSERRDRWQWGSLFSFHAFGFSRRA